MITTVTLNASIDKAYSLAAPLETGSVMRVGTCADSAGGKGLNASRAIATAGVEVLATGFVGGNTGKLLCELLDRDGIRESFVHVASETRCCVNVLEPSGRSTEFLEPGRSVTHDDMSRLEERVAELAGRSDVVTFSGSVPANVPDDVYATLVRSATREGALTILDTSGCLLERGIEGLPTMIKPNTDEMGALLGRAVAGPDEIADAAVCLHDRGIDCVVVSLGALGALMACSSGVFVATPPHIDVVNPVGSGDTMVGAFAVAMARGLAPAEQLRFSIACATANCLSPLTGRFSPDDARNLARRVHIDRIR